MRIGRLKTALPMSEETSEIVDMLLGDFLMSCIGKNDMAMVSAMLSAAALMIATHCERTGDDMDELVDSGHTIFHAAAELAADAAKIKMKL